MRELMIKRIMALSSPDPKISGGYFNSFRLFQKKNRYYGFTEQHFRAMTDAQLLENFEVIIAMAYRCYG